MLARRTRGATRSFATEMPRIRGVASAHAVLFRVADDRGTMDCAVVDLHHRRRLATRHHGEDPRQGHGSRSNRRSPRLAALLGGVSDSTRSGPIGIWHQTGSSRARCARSVREAGRIAIRERVRPVLAQRRHHVDRAQIALVGVPRRISETNRCFRAPTRHRLGWPVTGQEGEEILSCMRNPASGCSASAAIGVASVRYVAIASDIRTRTQPESNLGTVWSPPARRVRARPDLERAAWPTPNGCGDLLEPWTLAPGYVTDRCPRCSRSPCHPDACYRARRCHRSPSRGSDRQADERCSLASGASFASSLESSS